MNEQEYERVVSFFKVLIEIDKKKRITPTMKERYKKRESNGETERQEEYLP